MLLNNPGESFLADGKRFVIGEKVFSNANSDYAGLFGTIREIRDGEDQATENHSADIFCAFDPPESPAMVSELEKRFSDLYQCEKRLDELGLDDVIMAADMLEPIPEACLSVSGVYVLSSLRDNDLGTARKILGVSSSKGALLRRMLEDLKASSAKRALSYVKEGNEMLTLVFETEAFENEDSYLDYELTRAPILFDKSEVAA